MVPPGAELYAAWLDGMEHFGRPITLAEIAARGRFDLLVTGASAVSIDGVRFGKGHGFFDLEWGMFTDLGLADETTPVVAVVHDCQVVEDTLHAERRPTSSSTSSPRRRGCIEVERRARRPRGVKWQLLDPEQIASTPPLAGTAAPARPRLTPRTRQGPRPVSLKHRTADAFLAASATLPLLPGLARRGGPRR